MTLLRVLPAAALMALQLLQALPSTDAAFYGKNRICCMDPTDL